MYKNVKEFCEKFSKVYIFGNGSAAANVAEVMNYFKLHYDGYIISETYKKKGENEFYLSEIHPDDSVGLLMGCASSFYNEIVNDILKQGFNHIYFCENLFCIGYAMRKLKNMGVDVQKESLDMKNFSVANLFPYAMEDNRALVTYALEFPDLGYHYLGDDLCCFDEGPYEFENVNLKEGQEKFDEDTFEKVRLHKDDIVIDCGANIGMFSAVAAAKGCKVYAFEPAPAQIEYLEKTQKLYADKIEIVPKAIADYVGTAKFNICPGYNGGDSLINEFSGQDETIEVEVVTLDEFVKEKDIEKIAFIKADLEAAERMMLRGAEMVLKEHQPILSLCTYHRPDDVHTLTKIIKEINPNYKITYGWKKLYAWVD